MPYKQELTETEYMYQEGRGLAGIENCIDASTKISREMNKKSKEILMTARSSTSVNFGKQKKKTQ